MPLQDIGITNAKALQDIADTITKSHKVLVITGAGISTNCGIPDFRSKDGLYNMIPDQAFYPTPPTSAPSTPSRKRKVSNADEDEPPSSQSSTSSRSNRRCSNSPASRMKGQDLFHARVFQNADTTEVFYQFIASLRQKIHDDVKNTSATHKFIRTLRDGGRLMRCYTQNIDGLERREGLCLDLNRGKGNKRRFMKKYYDSPRPEQIQGTDYDGGCEVVQLHGELTKLRCTMCSTETEWTDEATQILLEGHPPKCEQCVTKSDIRLATGKRGLTVGGLRPNIVLYGEEHPQNTLLSPFVPYDISSKPDVLIIMGTSLKVHGLQKIIRDFAKIVHEQKNGRVIFVNRTRPAESVWDGIIDDFVCMDCDAWVEILKTRREDLWLRQGEINMKESKQLATKRKRKSVDALDDEVEIVSEKIKTKHDHEISIDVPKWDYTANKLAVASPKKSKTARATPWSKKTVAKETKIVEDQSLTHATPWKKRRTMNMVGTILTPRQPKSHQQRAGQISTNSGLQADLGDENSISQMSPLKPVFSPITPTYTPLNLTPRSRRSGKNSVVNTPSRLRITTDAEGATENYEDGAMNGKDHEIDLENCNEVQHGEDEYDEEPQIEKNLDPDVPTNKSTTEDIYGIIGKNRSFVHKLIASAVNNRLRR